jgi:hypothetical protein
MAQSGRRPRKPKRRLPRVPDTVRYPGMSRFPKNDRLTRGHEAEARAAQRARQPRALGRLVLRLLGGKPRPPRQD